MTVLYIILAIFGMTYLFNLISHFYVLSHTKQIIHKMKSIFLKAKNEPDKERKYIEDLLPLGPELKRLVPYSLPKITHGNSTEDNLELTVHYFNELLDLRDEQRNELKHILNPLNSIQLVFRLPAWLLKQFGFNMKRTTSNFVSFLGWLIPILVSLFAGQIQTWLFK